MRDYLPIARVYVRGSAVAVWSFLFLCLLAVSTSAEELARMRGGILGGVLSFKGYLAMFAYFNACLLGVQLRDNLAHPWATVLPHYRWKHILMATLIAVLFLGVPMFSMLLVETSDVAPLSVAVIFLTCLAAGLWTLHHPALGFLAFPFLVFVMAPSAAIPGFTAFLAGETPLFSAGLIGVSLLALCVLAWRLLTLREDRLEYAIARLWGDLFRGKGARTIADNLAVVQINNRKTHADFDPFNTPFSNLRQVDNLTGYSDRRLWQRLQLWRLGTSSTRDVVSLGMLILLSLCLVPAAVYMPASPGVTHPARDVTVIMAVMVMTNPVNLWLPWFTRLRRLGYESLRPRTRQEFVREIGLALLWDVIQCWLAGILFLGIAAFFWVPELLQARSLCLFVSGTAVGQLCAYVLIGFWLSRRVRRGSFATIAWSFCPFMAIALWMVCTMNGSLGVIVHGVIASVLAAVSAAMMPVTYRRWCRADLD